MLTLTTQSVVFAAKISYFLRNVNKQLEITGTRISTGNKINSFSDEPSTYIQSNNLLNNAKTLRGAVLNDLSYAAGIIDTAITAMDSIESIYTELTALAADSASDNPSQPRASLNARFNELRNEVTNIVNGAVYNGVAVLDGTYSSAFGGNDLSVMYSVDITQRLSLPIDKISTSGLGLDPLNISTQVGAISAYSSLTDSFTIGTALQRLNTRQYNFAQIKNIIEIHTNHINVQATNYESAASSLTEADVPLEVARQTALEVKKQSATAMIAQSNLSSQNIVNLINKVFMSN